MPNWIVAIEKAGQFAAEEIERSANGKGENLLSVIGHGSNVLDTPGANKIAGSINSHALSEMRASSLAIGDNTSTQLPNILIDDAAKKSANAASAKERTIYPWEHPLRTTSQGYDPWLEGI